MNKPKPRRLLLCAADLSLWHDARRVLEETFQVRYLEVRTPTALAAAIAVADAYYAALDIRLTAAMIAAAPRLKLIATPSTGLDHLDLDAAKERGIKIVSLKEERAFLDSVTATAELAWALVLACARRLPAAFDATRRGEWARDTLRGHQLSGKTCGIIGCGRLGAMVADYARAFRMEVIGHDIADITLHGVTMTSLERLLAQADVVSLHIHLTPANRHFINAGRLATMKPGAILINTSRGAIVDEAAVLAALKSGRLAAYGTDVIDGEWRTDLYDHPLITYARENGNVVITPHVGGVTHESQASAFTFTARRLCAAASAIKA